nr:AAA+-type ATPase [Ipomoea batatas]
MNKQIHMSYCTFPTLKILLKNYLGYDGANVENNIPNELEDVIEAAEIARRASTREELFIHGGYYLSRDIFQTLRSGELESMFLDIWCLRLNQLDLNRGIDKPKRMFFSTQTFLQLDSPSDWAKQPDSGKQLDFE